MAERRANSARSRRRRLVVSGWWALAGGAAVWIAGTGCSVEEHYELLSFFFDGVPNPNALPVVSNAGNPATMRQSPTYVAHVPWIEQKCDACHSSRFERTAVESSVCASCHGAVQDGHRYMHGPVALGACLWCHVGHESAYAALLKESPRIVCARCHDPAMLSVDRVPEHADEEVSCLRCHSGHGGDNRLMLKPESIDERGG